MKRRAADAERKTAPVNLPVPTVVVGGHTRNIGKTSVVEGIIRELPSLNWTAVKITQYGHGVCSRDGHSCQCKPRRHAFEISEESDARGHSDTCRFLAAGAVRSLWLRVRAGQLGDAVPALFQAVENSANVILESNSILQFIKPSLFLMVLDSSQRDFKLAAQKALSSADALVAAGGKLHWNLWSEIDFQDAKQKPVFPMDLQHGPGLALCEFTRDAVNRAGEDRRRAGNSRVVIAPGKPA